MGSNQLFLCLIVVFNYLFARGAFCRLLITFANSVDPNQDQQKGGPDLNPFTVWHSDSVPESIFLKSYFFKKKSADNFKSMKNYPAFKAWK